ncbi:MAG: XdhC family protein, partial [Myxococcota bacterium]
VLREGRTRALVHEGARVLVEAIRPPVSLLVLGAGPDAVPVVRLANELGWDVTVVDGRPAYARAEHFPGARAVLLAAPEAVADRVEVDSDSVVLVMTHHYLHDRELLRWLIATPARYVGVLGPRQRTLDLVHDLRDQSALPTDDVLARLHAPAGLDLGSEGVEEIALSILAEIQAVLAGRRGGPLRERKGPIHDPVA